MPTAVHPPELTREGMMRFADDWIAAWNRRDIEAVLSAFADDAVFVSPTAERVVGRSTLHNKAELEAYWRRALDQHGVLHFTLLHAAWDADRRELNVVYEANRNGEVRRACELMLFDEVGHQIRGEAFYGASA